MSAEHAINVKQCHNYYGNFRFFYVSMTFSCFLALLNYFNNIVIKDSVQNIWSFLYTALSFWAIKQI